MAAIDGEPERRKMAAGEWLCSVSLVGSSGQKYALDGGDDEAVQILGTTGDGVRWRWPATVN
jgi:hypothetical protein